MAELQTKKSLGQHWLRDSESLQAMVKAAEVTDQDTVLEIGPGLGTLTKYLVDVADKVVAVEFDMILANGLASKVPASNLTVIHQDILEFDLSQMPPHYKVAANIPYYITGKLLRMFSDTVSKPQVMALLVQKEVAERIAAGPSEMSILSVGTQLEYEVKLSRIVEAKLFTPVPKVDSRIVILSKRMEPLFDDLDKKQYMHLVKAGFSQKRKKLRSSLSAGLVVSKDQTDGLLKHAKISGDLRAQELSLQDWYKLYNSYNETISKT